LFAVITNPNFFNEIEQAINSKGSNILYKRVDNDVDILEEIEKLNRIPIHILIIDITCIEDKKKIPQAVRRFRIRNSNARIIIIAPNFQPGNEILSMLVTMGVYDIINPISEKTEDMVILPSLLDHIDNPATYAKAVKWDVSANEFTERTKDNEKVIVEKTRTVTIEKDRIIGTVVIAVSGTMHRIGTTHTVISLGKFLKDLKYKVALVELHKSQGFNFIKNSYTDVIDKGNMFTIDDIDYFPYSPQLSVLDVLQEDYNYIVIDMGIYNECNIVEFKRANERIIVSGIKDWELTELELILRTGDKILYKNKYLFNFADKLTFNFIKSNMDNLPCFLAPMNPQPFHKNKECNELFKVVLKDVLPKIEQKDNANIFKKLSSILPLNLKKKGDGGIET